MRFGLVPLDKAAGAILAHSVALDDGSRIRKGTRLGPSEIARLKASGEMEVEAAQLDDGDLHEDAAAESLAGAIVPDPARAHLRLGKAATGRVNLHAEAAGVLTLDAGAIHAANRVDPMVTVATLAPFKRVAPGDMVATIKIISYGVAEAAVVRACDLARGAMAVAAPVLMTARLIETRIGPDAPPGKGRKAMETRLTRLGLWLAERQVVPHREADIAVAVRDAGEDLVLILTASATSDMADTAPAALRAAGGTVERFGMPVDPGNLLFLGHLGERPVIGLPGCARSPALNGADWVLERVICGIDITGEDIAGMGVGGLLKESPARPHPRAGRRG
ncbi:molybdopterin-binding protein [Anianabacter salinae]|uniref:molybdopterin-binding protein n=1 Tax=Anianabacter salinae TaxID=2851023 RepID=UPI00225DEA2C|nr:molybdopterin-binding protein [Anianabacter salinae]MBV0911503.1 molybdopterin-binding protein [Anianabacter salinae]